MQSKQLQNLSTMIKATEYRVEISEKNFSVILLYINALSGEFKMRLQELKKIKTFLPLVENRWHLSKTAGYLTVGFSFKKWVCKFV